ncbi:MAG: hypothetical protein ACI4FO_04890, partial [Acutalibacteraceae bacterium]
VPSKRSDSSFSFNFARPTSLFKEPLAALNYSPFFILFSLAPLSGAYLHSSILTLRHCRTAAQNDKKPGTLRIPG